jgi:NAD(P)H dehydrogenase (quinone)
MKVLVLYAHPERRSFCGAVLDQFLAGVTQGGGEVRLRDLYQLHFNPCLGIEEFVRERKGGDIGAVPRDVCEEQEHVLWSDAIVFVCPLWWSDVPAILKGWFDRVWTKGFAWAYSGTPELRQGRSRRALMLVTAGASLEKLKSDGIVEALQSVVVGDRFRNAGFEAEEVVFFPNLDRADGSELRGHLHRALSLGARVAAAK